MPNEPAEDRSVRGNTIKPAKVEPDQEIERQFISPSKKLNFNEIFTTVEATLSVSSDSSGTWKINPEVDFQGDEIFMGGDVSIEGSAKEEGQFYAGFSQIDQFGQIEIPYANDGPAINIQFKGTFYDP